MGLGVYGFRVQDLGFKTQGLGFGVPKQSEPGLHVKINGYNRALAFSEITPVLGNQLETTFRRR